ncbi:GGDEF domain-containing protein [Rhodospirillum rubrum]|nr:GGDEF domain-containing protein [Rhodospirillum rubrum]
MEPSIQDLRSSASATDPKRPRRLRLGIGTHLWIAFLSIGALSTVVTLIAFNSYNQATATFKAITHDRLPAIVAVAKLADDSNALLTTLPHVVLVDSAGTLSEHWRDVAEAEERLNRSIAAVEALPAPNTRLTDFSDLSGRISAQLQILLSALQEARGAQRDILDLATQMDLLHQKVRLLMADAGTQGRIPPDSLYLATRLLSLLGEVLASDDANDIAVNAGRIDQSLQRLQASISAKPNDAIAEMNNTLIAIGSGPNGLVARKRLALRAGAVAKDRLRDVRALSRQIGERVQGMLGDTMIAVDADRQATEKQLHLSKILLAATSATGLLGAILIAWLYVGRAIVARLDRLSYGMREIADGHLKGSLPIGGKDEIGEMARAVSVFRDAMERIDYLASNDSLTGLLNRHSFLAGGERLLARGQRRGWLISINLRRFKDVNQMFGHQTGDTILGEVADRLRRLAGPEDLVARLGGDDFALLALDPDDEGRALALCRNILAALRPAIVIGHASLDIEACIGFAGWPEDAEDQGSLLRRAELAMQQAKNDPGDPICRYRSALSEDLEVRSQVRKDLRAGIIAGELRLLYQPKVDLRSGRVVGMEALVRWNHPRHGLIPPARFIPVAETSGLIIPLGEWVLEECCRQLRLWRDDGMSDLKGSVNMSPVQVFSQDVAALVAEALHTTGLPAEALEIEITEGVFVHDEQRARRRLEGLRALGVGLAIDDFGTGYSALAYLKRLPATSLKIDQSFIREVTDQPEQARLCRAIIGVGHDFGLTVVAEGIETAEHLAFLRAEGCDFGQGYYFAKPLEAQDFAKVLRDQPWLTGDAAQ